MKHPEQAFDAGREQYEAYDRQPDIGREPQARTMEAAQEIAKDLRLQFQQIVREVLQRSGATGKEYWNDEEQLPGIQVIEGQRRIQEMLRMWGYGSVADKVLPDEVLFVVTLPPRMDVATKPGTTRPDTLWQEAYLWARGKFIDAIDALHGPDGRYTVNRINPAGVHTNDYYHIFLVSPRDRTDVDKERQVLPLEE